MNACKYCSLYSESDQQKDLILEILKGNELVQDIDSNGYNFEFLFKGKNVSFVNQVSRWCVDIDVEEEYYDKKTHSFIVCDTHFQDRFNTLITNLERLPFNPKLKEK